MDSVVGNIIEEFRGSRSVSRGGSRGVSHGRSRSGSPVGLRGGFRGGSRSGSPVGLRGGFRGGSRSGSPVGLRDGSRYHGNYNKNVKAINGSGVITPRQPANRKYATSIINDNVNNNISPLYPITQANSPQSTGGYLNSKNYIRNPIKLNKTYYPSQEIQTPVVVNNYNKHHGRWRRRGRGRKYNNHINNNNNSRYGLSYPYYNYGYGYNYPYSWYSYPYYNPYYWFNSYENTVPATTTEIDVTDNNEKNQIENQKQIQLLYENDAKNQLFNTYTIFIAILIILLFLFMKK
jgi:hypothetical protein